MRWIPCELHTHTENSDGKLNLESLAVKATELGIECIALTDHNTISGHLEIPGVMKKTGVQILYGMEWTTFYGHMVALGIHEYADWKDIGKTDIQKGMSRIHMAGGLAGIAHPFRLGSPVCTGCYWQYEVSDWSQADYIEVWSETDPHLSPSNKRAYDLWTGLLNKGYRISAVSGRDWHGDSCGNDKVALTYLGLNGHKDFHREADYLDAVKKGSVSVTLGPLIKIWASTGPDERSYGPGEEMRLPAGSSRITVKVELDFSVRPEKWKLDAGDLMVVLTGNDGFTRSISVPFGSGTVSEVLNCSGLKWLRAELDGEIEGRNAMIAFTNPVYFK